ncbi:hypothetical protein [Actinomadura yumaensis]|uniref:DUF308 domain-containing protein n=1 Tax=Actinomadura yumaensis TaxID=111807 RepID=A0ABW2CX05_9ACTN
MNRRGNGLSADTYAPLVDLAPHLADAMLAALRDSGVAAYAAAPGDPDGAGESSDDDALDRLYVDVEMKTAAEGILRAHLARLRDAGARDAGGTRGADPDGRDTDPALPDLPDATLPGSAPRDLLSTPPNDLAGLSDLPGRPGASPRDGDRDRDRDDARDPRDPREEQRDAASDAKRDGDDTVPSAPVPPGTPSAQGDSPTGTAERDEDAIWAEIVAGYDSTVPEGDRVPWPDQENIDEPAEPPREGDDRTGRLPRARVIKPAETVPDFPDDAGDEGHYVPPPPPPLPSADPLTKGAWIALIGGPVYLLITVILDWDVPGWAAFLAVAAFIGGFVTLVLRMGDEPRDPDDGAVV